MAPPSIHATIFSFSLVNSDRSFENFPYFGSGDHGGILPASTAARIAFAHGRVSSKVRSDMGAISPGRWQPWQRFCKIGSMSLWNVRVTGAAWSTAACEAAASIVDH